MERTGRKWERRRKRKIGSRWIEKAGRSIYSSREESVGLISLSFPIPFRRFSFKRLRPLYSFTRHADNTALVNTGLTEFLIEWPRNGAKTNRYRSPADIKYSKAFHLGNRGAICNPLLSDPLVFARPRRSMRRASKAPEQAPPWVFSFFFFFFFFSTTVRIATRVAVSRVFSIFLISDCRRSRKIN